MFLIFSFMFDHKFSTKSVHNPIFFQKTGNSLKQETWGDSNTFHRATPLLSLYALRCSLEAILGFAIIKPVNGAPVQ